ncbi:MAG TPA: hypothetical protein VK203_27315 [Nostocaceae cyanobacterium]|nr:hypothetical protein [Nostocaceae cyanobacterium]
METNRKFNNLEISDLIDAAVNNAVSRRNQAVESEEALLDVSDEEANNVSGGALAKPIIAGFVSPTVLGKIAYPPTTIGIIATEPVDYLA